MSGSIELIKEVMEYTLGCLGFIMHCKFDIQLPLCSVLSVFYPLLQVKKIAQLLSPDSREGVDTGLKLSVQIESENRIIPRASGVVRTYCPLSYRVCSG